MSGRLAAAGRAAGAVALVAGRPWRFPGSSPQVAPRPGPGRRRVVVGASWFGGTAWPYEMIGIRRPFGWYRDAPGASGVQDAAGPGGEAARDDRRDVGTGRVHPQAFVEAAADGVGHGGGFGAGIRRRSYEGDVAAVDQDGDAALRPDRGDEVSVGDFDDGASGFGESGQEFGGDVA